MAEIGAYQSDPATITITVEAGDADGDGIPDDQDNCIDVSNGPRIPDRGGYSQRDTDLDGYGNVCDPDFDNSGLVDQDDVVLLRGAFGSETAADQDLNGDGVVDAFDIPLFRTLYGKAPGPSCCGR